MAGVKGRSGGPRPNSGGKRAGAGRKRKAPAVVDPGGVESHLEPQARGGALKRQSAEAAVSNFDDPLEFLKAVWRGDLAANANQVNAAKAALAYMHRKLGEGGKKEQKQEAAQKVAGRFAAAAPPKLVVAGGKRI